MGTEYETRVILNMALTILKNRRQNTKVPDTQRELDEVIKEIEAVRDGTTK